MNERTIVSQRNLPVGLAHNCEWNCTMSLIPKSNVSKCTIASLKGGSNDGGGKPSAIKQLINPYAKNKAPDKSNCESNDEDGSATTAKRTLDDVKISWKEDVDAGPLNHRKKMRILLTGLGNDVVSLKDHAGTTEFTLAVKVALAMDKALYAGNYQRGMVDNIRTHVEALKMTVPGFLDYSCALAELDRLNRLCHPNTYESNIDSE